MIKIYDIETLEEREILFRGGSGADVSAPVAEILRAVQERGDAALREYTLRFDGAAPDALAVTAEEVDQAAAQVEPAFLAVLEEAAEHIRAYHSRQVRSSYVMTEEPGVVEVSFPDVPGIPDGFEDMRKIIEDILPCHLEIRYVYWYVTWARMEEQFPRWNGLEGSGLSWEELEKMVY